MISKSYVKTLLLLSLLFWFNSCYRLIDEDFSDFDKKPVLNSFLLADEPILVHLSFTASLSDTVVMLIENAEVIIESSEGWRETLLYEGDGYYSSSHIASAGHTYRCEATVPSFQALSAATTLPQQPAILSDVVFTPVADRDDEGDAISSYRFLIKNDKSKLLFWELALLEERESFWSDGIEKYEHYIYLDPGADAVMRYESQPLTLFSNKKMESDRYQIEIFVPYWQNYMHEGDSYIELRAVDEAYYRYEKSYALYETSGGSGLGSSTQSYPLYSNVQNGYGIFASYSAFRFPVKMSVQK